MTMECPDGLRDITHLFPIKGHRVSLQLVRPVDAAFIHGLRSDPAYNAHLSAVPGTVDDQRDWITRYMLREAAGQEFYCLITRNDTGQPCGVVRLYDVADGQFTWGSWILNADKPAKAALESAVLSFGLGFEVLGMKKALLDVRLLNTHAKNFYLRFGATPMKQDAINLYLKVGRLEYQIAKAHYQKVMRAESE